MTKSDADLCTIVQTPRLYASFVFYSKVDATVLDNDDGSYTVSYTPMEAGTYSTWVCVKAQHVKVTDWFCNSVSINSPVGQERRNNDFLSR